MNDQMSKEITFGNNVFTNARSQNGLAICEPRVRSDTSALQLDLISEFGSRICGFEK